MPITNTEIRAAIRRRLGGTRVTIELEDTDIDGLIQDSLRIYGRYKPIVRHHVIDIVAGQTVYQLTEEKTGQGLLDVTCRPSSVASGDFDYENINEFELVYRTTGTTQFDVVLGQINSEMRQRASSSDFYWEYDPVERQLFLTAIPDGATKASYRYFDSPTLEEIIREDEDWIHNYTLALAREVLAEIRGKYTGIPGNTASPDTNASDLRSRAEAEMERLEEDLKSRRADAWMLPQ